MVEFQSLRPVLPALRAYHAAQKRAAHFTPGGVLLKGDLVGIRRWVAHQHRITPEDLQRWYDRLSFEQRQLLLAAE